MTLLSDLDFQVRCHRTADEKVVSVPTFRAEISLARVLTALGTITWWDGMGLQTELPPGMAFDTNFYPGDFSNGNAFTKTDNGETLSCGADHYVRTRLAFAIFQMTEAGFNVPARPKTCPDRGGAASSSKRGV